MPTQNLATYIAIKRQVTRIDADFYTIKDASSFENQKPLYIKAKTLTVAKRTATRLLHGTPKDYILILRCRMGGMWIKDKYKWHDWYTSQERDAAHKNLYGYWRIPQHLAALERLRPKRRLRDFYQRILEKDRAGVFQIRKKVFRAYSIAEARLSLEKTLRKNTVAVAGWLARPTKNYPLVCWILKDGQWKTTGVPHTDISTWYNFGYVEGYNPD